MSLPIVFRPIARSELDEAMAWYRRKKFGLEKEFEQSVDEMLHRITAHPLRFHRARGEVRCALLRRFPYAIYYVPENDAVIILAIFHTKRDPTLLEERS